MRPNGTHTRVNMFEALDVDPAIVRTTYVVAAYEIDRAYGGPEEGGWWFDTGELIRVLRVFKNDEKAYAFCRRANGKLAYIEERNGTRSVDSVIYDGGRISVQVFEGTAPESYPAERPFYE